LITLKPGKRKNTNGFRKKRNPSTRSLTITNVVQERSSPKSDQITTCKSGGIRDNCWRSRTRHIKIFSSKFNLGSDSYEFT